MNNNTSASSGLAKAWKAVSKQKAVVVILAILVLMLIPKTNFYTSYNWLDMLRSTAILEIVAFGVTIPVICGGCDLSVGGTLCLGGIVAVMIINAGMPIWMGFVAAIACGVVIGLINGFLIVHQKTAPFIITLGMGMLLKGICQQLTNAHPLTCSVNASAFMKIANGKLFGSIPNLVVYMFVLAILFFILLRFTSFGRNCYAIGGNYDVAQNSGIAVVRIKWTAYIICGVTAAVAGVLLSSKMRTGSSVFGDDTGMRVNCGVVIGGTSFAGGVGGIVESFIGLFAVQLINNCMSMLGIDGYVQRLAEGLLIVLIIFLDCYFRKLKRERV